MAFDVREIWNFGDPAGSESRFRKLLEDKCLSHEEELEVWAQLARTFSLRSECEECHRLLDERWEEAMAAGGRPKACFELEKGRAFRSGGDPIASKPLFETAAASEVEDLKIDALHMLAILKTGEESKRINLQALAIAEASSEMFASRWQGTLCNNLGWEFFGEGAYSEASTWFARALAEREKYGQEEAILIARWCLARSLRAEGRFEEALEMQLVSIERGAGGYALEEAGENLVALGRIEDAKPYFRQAIEELESELGPDSERIQRMKSLC